MLKLIAAASVSAFFALTIPLPPIHAQPSSTQVSPDAEYVRQLNRAKNLARMTVERANGGLGNYRAESAMHGPPLQSPYVDNGDGTWTFTFQGRSPYSDTYTMESVVTVSEDGVVTMDYNGPIR